MIIIGKPSEAFSVSERRFSDFDNDTTSVEEALIDKKLSAAGSQKGRRRSSSNHASTAKSFFKRPQAWQTTVTTGAGIAAAVLLVNIAFLGWTLSHPVVGGIATIFEGESVIFQSVESG